jgi:CubicO group peptidase (beta-lactamase class C family)
MPQANPVRGAARVLLAALAAFAAAPAGAASLDEIVRAAHAAGQFDGVVLVDRGGRTVYRRATGAADRITQQMHTGGEIWRWGGISQQVAAVLVMQEVERGRLRLDGTLADYLPGFGGASLQRITLRQLLLHTSGLANPDDSEADVAGVPSFYRAEGAAAADKAALRFCAGTPKSAPGARYEDNTCDYLVLAAVLERLTGASYAKLVAQRIAKPAKLRSLGLQSPLRTALPTRVVGYTSEGLREPAFNLGRYGASGALYGTPDDLLRFDRALLESTYVSPATTAAMWHGEPRYGNVAFGALAYAARLERCPAPVEIVERRGELGGVRAVNVLAPGRDLALVAFSNTAATDYGHVLQGSGLLHDLLDAALCAPDAPDAAPKKPRARARR